MEFYILPLFGILLGVLEVYFSRKNKKFKCSGIATKNWLTLYRYRWLLGLPMAVGAYFLHWTVEKDAGKFTIVGFPFMVVGFDAAGRDYVSSFTIPAAFLNALIWYSFSHVILFLSGPALKKVY